MSIIKVTSVIEKVLDNSFGNGAVVKNNFRSAISGEVIEFNTEYCTIDSWVLNNTTGPAFSIDILALIDPSYIAEDITFIHIQCHKKVILPADQPDPVRFNVDWGGTVLGDMSQFQVANCELTVPITDITITNIAAAANTEAILTIVVGLNK